MKINRMSDEKLAPSWALNKIEKSAKDLGLITEEDAEVLSRLPRTLTNENIVGQREKIEACASNNSVYYCRSDWDNKNVSSLKEYATICGLDENKFKVVEAESVEDLKQVRASDSKEMIKGVKKAELISKASKNPSEAVELIMKDPFNIDELQNASEIKKSWSPEIQKQAKLEEKPSMLTNAVKPIRGGEDYFKNSDVNLSTQNSITNPSAIEKFIETAEDNGAKLKKQKEISAQKKEDSHKEWEQDKIDIMKDNMITNRRVFVTESMTAQPGIYSDVEKPDKTAGEKIAEVNETRRKTVEEEKNNFVAGGSSFSGISESFAEQLSKFLKK